MLDRAEALDLDPHDVAAAQEARRVHRLADALGRAGEDDVAGLERDVSAMKSTSACGPKIRSAVLRVLAQLAVDRASRSAAPAASGTSSAVVIHGPQGHDAVEALGARPLRLAALEVAGGDVVGDRVAARSRRRRR